MFIDQGRTKLRTPLRECHVESPHNKASLSGFIDIALLAEWRSCKSHLPSECNTGYTPLHSYMNKHSTQQWVLLIHQLPPRPTNLRVRIWRQLQKLGAVAIKNSVYVLPANDKTFEDFQWLKQEIESAGGEAAVFRGSSVEGATDQQIIETFQKSRDQEFAALTAELEGLSGAVREQARGRHLSASRLATHEAELNKLHVELERIIENDFFAAAGRITALDAYQGCENAIRLAQTSGLKRPRGGSKDPRLDIGKFQGRRWMTRRNLHVDRLASAWLIKQFVDKRPRFYFVGEGETIDGAIPFDMYGAEFTHQGEDCSFETILKRFGLYENVALRELSEIVHDIDLKDDKFHRFEAAGLNAIINGLSQTLRNDRKLLQQTSIIFDGLLALLTKSKKEQQGKQPRKATSSKK